MRSLQKVTLVTVLSAGLAAVAAAGAAQTQHPSTGPSTELRTGSGPGYPTRPVRIVVGFSAGSATDITARMVGPRLSEIWGQAVVIDNRPGAGGTIAAASVAKAAPDAGARGARGQVLHSYI